MIIPGNIVIQRIQQIPTWAAVLVMAVAFTVSMFLESVFVR
jgi:hypothetical protein